MKADVASQAERCTAYDLCNFLERFESRNQFSSDADDRYLVKVVKEQWLPLAREIRNSNIGPDLREKINAMRAEEITEAIASKQRDLDVLHRDLKRLKPETTRKVG